MKQSVQSGGWAKISLFPIGLAGLVLVVALAVNLAGPPYNAESVRIAEASQLVTLARNAYSTEDWLGARDYASQALALNPNHVSAHIILGLSYLNVNAFDLAETEFRQVLAVAKQDRNSLAWAHNNLGVVYQRRGQLEIARQEYETALEVDPSNVQARLNLSLIQTAVP
ncbi:MAG: tetratricopeptide repeat protein [Dehalococcoidia bacterium]|nr:tetratricopeptide repeat protein [Dehalococcoidia bacterium]